MSSAWRIWRKRLISYPRRRLRALFTPLRRLLRPPSYESLEKRVLRLEQDQRRLLRLLYAPSAAPLDQVGALRQHELRALSENGEAGILLYLFSQLGTTDRRVIEFGIGQIEKCNAANLTIAFGWNGLLIDGSGDRVEAARRYFAQHAGRAETGVCCVQGWILPETVNATFRDNGFEGPIDLLSIDIDGNDYWVWQAIDVVQPRVVIVEYNASFGPEECVVTRYEPRFDRYARHPLGWYHGASLAALEKLGRQLGYLLIGCESSGHNAFFVHRDVAAGKFQAVSPKEAFYADARRLRVASQAEQWASVRDLPFERP